MSPSNASESLTARPSLRSDLGLSANQLLTADQLAQRWQVPRSHVYRLSRSGQIPHVKLGRYLRYRVDAIEAWEEGQ
jgi:excisionase family DNA binding protein